MIIPCFRCGKELNSPNAFNADYIMAEDTKEGDIQKTGIVCLDCYRDTDFVIWGVHKDVG